MDIVGIVVILAGLVLLVVAGGGVIAYFAFAVPAMRAAPPLSEEDRAACRKLIREWKAYPFLCRASVRKGACPCQPCPKLGAAKAEKGHG